ncbi:MAG: S24 family peptidase [Bacteroidota bacterium]
MENAKRKELNRRFKEVYQQLVERGEIVKNCRQKSKSAFAHKIGTKGHIIDLFLQSKRTITYEQAKHLCAHYDISEAYMFQGIGTPFEKPRIPDPEKKLAMALGINFSPNILFTNIEAFASNTVGVDLLEENESFHIPGLEGDLVAFNINGESMSPTILAGDMVICTPLKEKHEMVDNDIYAVVANQSVWVKRVKRCLDKYGRWTHLKLISDNYLEYDPFIIELTEVRKLLRVKRRLTGFF